MSIGLFASTSRGRYRRWRLDLGSVSLTLLVCCPLALAMCWPIAKTVWQTGGFVDTDDATRIVQIRDWMTGQAWFDLSAHRMGLPQGLFSHWSRVVDVPVAALIRLFGLFFAPDLAERAARIAYPLALQAGLIAAMAYAARILAGPGASLWAGLLVVLGGIGCYQFQPGRVHHHSPQILLLTLIAATTLDSLDPARARRAGVTGVLVAASLAIGLENLPFLAVILVVLPVAWAVAGRSMRPALLWSATSLAVATPAFYIATVAPSRYAISTVDAFSLVHLVAILLGAFGSVLLALATPRLASTESRWLALAALGIVLGAVLAAGFPEALHGPFYGMDPLLRPFWLDEVQEVRPFFRLAAERPDVAAAFMIPLVLGTVAAGAALARSRGLARSRWIALTALLAVGFAGSVWAIRVASSLQPLALLGAAWGVARLYAKAKAGRGQMRMLLPYAALALCSSSVWSLLPSPAGDAAASRSGPSCMEPGAFAPLATLAPGVTFAPIDSGPFILVHTGLSVLAGPYHRDNAGNRAVIEGFLAPPDAARALVRATGARYLADCGDLAGLESAAAPGGLAAALRDGRVPDWLEPLPLGPTPFRIYAVH